MNDIQYFRTCVVVDEGQPNIPESHILRVVFASHYDAVLARESALREELATSREAFKEELDGVKYTRRKFRQDRDALQQRLTVAEQRASELEQLLQMFIDNSDDKDVVELSEYALKPAAEQRATEMEMDKRRLDFLQENLVSINCRVRNTGFCGPRGREFAAYIYAAVPNDKKPGEGETLRQAIDSMMENNGDALKPAEEPHKCIECDSQYCHGVCVERGDDDERYKGAEGEGS